MIDDTTHDINHRYDAAWPKGNDMTHPTDEELEAMAVELECDQWLDAAAMLRACKGQPAPDHSERNAAIEAAAKVARERLYPKNPQDDWTEYAKIHAAAAIEVSAAIRALAEKGPPQ